MFAVSPTQNKQHNGEKNKQRWSEVGQSTILSRRLLSLPPPFQPTHIDPIDTSSDTQTAYFVPFPQTLHNLAPRMQDTRPKPLPVFAQFLVCGPCQVLCYLGRLVAHQYIMQNMQLSTLCEYIVCSDIFRHPCVLMVCYTCYQYFHHNTFIRAWYLCVDIHIHVSQVYPHVTKV